jgi:hypothetical protein
MTSDEAAPCFSRDRVYAEQISFQSTAIWWADFHQIVAGWQEACSDIYGQHTSAGGRYGTAYAACPNSAAVAIRVDRHESRLIFRRQILSG